MAQATENMFDHLSIEAPDEEVTALAATDRIRIERIISSGQASPPGLRYD
jgi:cupin 2 domain-containing protein